MAQNGQRLSGSPLSVAVVGGGIFGALAATRAAGLGAQVVLFEREPDLMQAASGINQYRLHRGYHYPRSLETAISSRDAEPLFVAAYAQATLDEIDHYYCIAAEGSKVTPEQYLRFCDAAGLEYEQVAIDLVTDKVGISLRATERLFDPAKLRELVRCELRDANVDVQLKTEATPELLAPFDFVVLAAYARNNELLAQLGLPLQEYQFEVCEKPVVRMPASFGNTSLVIMDGPFMCVDPLGDTGNSVLGNVVHAIHSTNDGYTPEVDENIAGLMNKGIVPGPPITNIDLFIESGVEYIPSLRDAEHLGSMFTVRTVLPRRDATDERPTLVTMVTPRIMTLFSGKIGTSITAAEQVAQHIAKEAGLSASI